MGPRRFLVWTGVPLSLVLPLVAAFRVPIWLDESATLWSTDLPMRSFVDWVTQKGDAVHAAYYGVLRVWQDMLGESPFVARSLSGVSLAVAVAGIIVLARRLDGHKTALWSGVALALLPFSVEIGAEARSMSLAMAIVTWATVLFHSAVWASGGRSWRAWFLYGTVLLVGVYVFLFTLLMIVAHAASIAWMKSGVRPWRSFVAVVSAVAAMSLPLVALAYGQRVQVSWLTRVDVLDFVSAPFLWAPRWSGAVLWLMIALAVWKYLRGGQAGWVEALRQSRLLGIAIPWMAVPIGALLTVSLVIPMYIGRYVAFTTPAFALLIGWAITRIRPAWLPVGMCVLALLLALPSYPLSGPGRDGWSAKRSTLLSGVTAGDGLLAEPDYYRRMAVVDPIPGLAILQGPISSPVGTSQLISRLEHVDRVWVMSRNPRSRDENLRMLLETSGFELIEEYPPPAGISLYVRT